MLLSESNVWSQVVCASYYMPYTGVLRSREGRMAPALQELHSAWCISHYEPRMIWQDMCQGSATHARAHGGCRTLWAQEWGVGPQTQLIVLLIPLLNSDPSSYHVSASTFLVYIFIVSHLECSSILPATRQCPLNQLFLQLPESPL